MAQAEPICPHCKEQIQEANKKLADSGQKASVVYCTHCGRAHWLFQSVMQHTKPCKGTAAINQPLLTGKQAGNQIVSKGKYAANVGKKSSLSVMGVGLMGIGIVGFLVTALIVLIGVMISLFSGLGGFVVGILFSFFILVIFGGGSAFLFWAGQHTINEAKLIDPGVPLTRANTADLPAPDSLVRASQEPVQEQEAVLLRAATESQERYEEHLVRASAGGTEQV